jgi:nucleoside-diphosphate-sugar epimerase
MAITFRSDSVAEILQTRAREMVTLGDLLDHLKVKAEKGLLGHGEVFDARNVVLDLSQHELHELAEAVQKAVGGRRPGPVGVVTNSGFVYGLAKAYAAIAEERSTDFQVFTDLDEAVKWVRSAVSARAAAAP